MKIFGMPVLHLEGGITGPLIPATELSRLIEEHRRLQGARMQAASILRRARKTRREIIFHSRQQAALEQEREMIELRALLQQDTLQEIREAIVWLVDEQLLEKSIHKSLYMRAVNWAVEILKEWGALMDWEALIAAKIAMLARSHLDLDPDNLILSVHPESIAKIQAALPASFQVRVEADHNLMPSHAVLENNLLRIDVDLQKQFDLLVSQLERRIATAGDENGS